MAESVSNDLMDERTRLYRDQSEKSATSFNHSYRGIPEQSPNLAHVADLVKASVARGSRIAALADGTGALSQRLADSGFAVEAADYVVENFRPRAIPFRQVDLNTDFSAKWENPFDGVVAAAIIEHLENPRHFLREIRRMLRRGGKLFLATPNIDSTVSKACMLAFGSPLWFNDTDYSVLGHITPLSSRLIAQAARETGYRVDDTHTRVNAWQHVRSWPKMRVFSTLVWLLDRGPKHLRGDSLVMVLSAA